MPVPSYDDLKKRFAPKPKPAPAPAPKPATLGTGYASDAAKKATGHNEQVKAAAKELDSYKKGGKVRRTGPAKLHKGEHVLTTKQVKKPVVKNMLGNLAKGDDYAAEMKGVAASKKRKGGKP